MQHRAKEQLCGEEQWIGMDPRRYAKEKRGKAMNRTDRQRNGGDENGGGMDGSSIT